MSRAMDAGRLNTAFGLMAIVFWSATVGLARSLSDSIGPLTACGAVYLIGGIAGLILLLTRLRLRKYLSGLSRRYLFGCGALFVLYSGTLYATLGLARSDTQALELGLIHYLWPALTLLASVLIFRWRARPMLVVGLLVATGGVWLAVTRGQSISLHAALTRIADAPWVYALAVVAALSWALYSALSRKWGTHRGAGAVPLFMLATGVILLGLAAVAEPPRAWPPKAWWELAALSIAPNLGYFLWDRAMRGGDLALVAACSYFTPLLSVAFASLYMRVLPGWSLWTGCLLVALGAAVCRASIRTTPD